MEETKGVSAVNVLFGWLRKRSKKVKIALGTILSLFLIVSLKFTVKKSDHFFLASEAIHALGILVLIYKLTRQKTCSGLSLKSQEVTAIFLVMKVICSLTMEEEDIHTYLDLTALILTLWVIYMIRYKLKSSYLKELDNLHIYYLIGPCIVLALLINPHAPYNYFIRVMWAFCIYSESISVLPQLRLMQNAKMIEPFTAYYVFALGISRFLSFANWLIQVYETSGHYLYVLEAGNFWFIVALLAEIVQTFILADFCYYYIKSVMEGQLVLNIPV